jgi:hypothetical protein
VRFRAANSTILLVTGIAAFVQSVGSIRESFAHAAVAALGIALAVVAGWLQLPARPSTGGPDPGPPAGQETSAGRPKPGERVSVTAVPGGTGKVGGKNAGTADPRSREAAEPALSGQIAVTTFLLLICYLLVFLAGLATVDYSAYLYEAGTRPTTRLGVLSPGSPGSAWEWALTPGARSVTTFRRADDGSRDAMLLLGDFAVISCGALDWTLSTDGDRPLSGGTIEARTRQRFRIPLPDRDRSTTLQLTLERADTQECTAVFSSSPFWAAGRPRIPLPGLATYIESTTR